MARETLGEHSTPTGKAPSNEEVASKEVEGDLSTRLYEKNWWITEAMIRFGGSFVRELGKMYRIADQTNASRLRSAFPELWVEYEKLAEKTKKEVKE